MQVDDATYRGLILLQAQGQTFAPMLFASLEAGLHPNHRRTPKCDGGTDHRFIFKTDRAEWRASDAAPANPG